MEEGNHLLGSDGHGGKFGFGGGGHNKFYGLRNGENGAVKSGHGFVFGEKDMRAGTAAGARLLEVSCIGVAGKNHGTRAVGDAIVCVCGNIVEELVYGVGGGIGGRGLLVTNGTEVNK